MQGMLLHLLAVATTKLPLALPEACRLHEHVKHSRLACRYSADSCQP